MLDVFAFSNKDNPDDSKSAFGIRQEENDCIFFAVEGEDSPCIAETLTARWQGFGGTPTAEQLSCFLAQAGENVSAAAFALNGSQGAWTRTENAGFFLFHGSNSLPAAQEGQLTTDAGDAILLCTATALRYLEAEEILIDLIKASNAREWAELLLMRVMERLPQAPEGLSMLAIRIIPEE